MAKYLELLLSGPEVKPLLYTEYFTVDGTLLRAWASHSSLERIDGLDDGSPPPTGGQGFGLSCLRQEARQGRLPRPAALQPNPTLHKRRGGPAVQESSGVRAFLSFMGTCLMENRYGLVIASEVTQAGGTAERHSALRMARSLKGAHQKNLGADKGYHTREFVADMRINGITPLVTQNIQASRPSAIDDRNARHQGYAQSINARKRIERVIGWNKQAAELRQL